jgi:aminoglycoside phosphotransferase (APT) family kinase protein
MPEAFAECPARLRSESAQAARRGFFHLELSPRHILGGVRTGIVDLELASSFGDPALDLGYLLGVCLRYRRGAEAAGEILRGYREAAAHSWSGMERRTVAFAACTLVRTGEDARLADARMLLDRGL